MKGNILMIGAVSWCCLALGFALDQNANQQSDVWEMLFSASGDFDADGWSNAAESSAGTNPKDASSHPEMVMYFVAGMPAFSWPGLKGKHYALLSSIDLTSFAPTGDVAAGGWIETTDGEFHSRRNGCERFGLSGIGGGELGDVRCRAA